LPYIDGLFYNVLINRITFAIYGKYCQHVNQKTGLLTSCVAQKMNIFVCWE